MIEFFIPMKKIPTVTHQQKQVHVVKGKPHFYEPADLKNTRSKFIAHLGQHVPEKKLEGPVQLIVKWCYPRGNHSNGTYKVTKPDLDNSQKLLQDCMTTLGFWKDDSQVVSLLAQKFWSDVPGIYIKLEEVA